MKRLFYVVPFTEEYCFIPENGILDGSNNNGLNVGIGDWDDSGSDFGGEVD